MRGKNIGVMLIFVIGYFLLGCSHLVFKHTLKGPSIESGAEKKFFKIKKVAIFPFADYSFQQNSSNPLVWGANRKIIEDLTDEFITRGIVVAVQEDTEGLLFSEDIIKPVDTQEMAQALERVKNELSEKEEAEASVSIISPEYELSRQHSGEMLSEIGKLTRNKSKPTKEQAREYMVARIFKIMSLYPQEPAFQGVTTALSKEKIMELGKRLGVDAIVRGRIIEAGTIDKTNESGVTPFLFKPLAGFLFGKGEPSAVAFAQKKEYENGLVDAFAVQSYATGKKISVIQIRAYIQDVSTGEIIYSGRSEVQSDPKIFKEYRKGLFDKSIRKAVKSLMKEIGKVCVKSPRPPAGKNVSLNTVRR